MLSSQKIEEEKKEKHLLEVPCGLIACCMEQTVCPRLKPTESIAVASRLVESPAVVLQSDSVLQTFDECVSAGGSDCAPEKLWLQIPFFCGHYSECW